MHVEKKRIFVGNLPPYVDENDIKKQFSSYGNVVSIDIKQRKVNTDEIVSPVFAFVNVEIDNNTLQKCFHELSNYDWQGYYVKLELAKESFLDRLKREREENQSTNSQNNSNNSLRTVQQSVPPPNNVKRQVYNSDSDSDDSKPIQNGKIIPTKTIKKKESSSSSSSSDSDSDDERTKSTQNNKVTPLKIVAKVSKQKESSSSSSNSSDSDSSDEEPKKVKQTNKTLVAEEIDEDGIKLVIKSNKHRIQENGGLKIESFNSTPIHVITKKGVKNEHKDKKSLEADAKRRQSLTQMKNSYNQQKSAIRNALSKIDTKPNFDEQSKKRKHIDDINSSTKKQKLSLFDDDNVEEHEENINFAVKNQFEGKKGQKLLQLQSRFTNDKRFALDERFAEEEQEDNEMEGVDDDEKEKQFEILESVLGRKVRKDFKEDSKNSNFTKGMLRFDPSKPEHSKFEIKRVELSKKDKRKERKEKLKETVEQAPIPEVSKDTFYQVTDNLKESLKEKEGFSLLSMFGRVEEKDEVENEPETSEKINKTNNKFDHDKNPFKYDSSDTEDEGQEKRKKKQKQTTEVEPRAAFKWSESFFFEADDNRLKDGLEFLKNVSSGGNFESFEKKRRALYHILQGKVKNVERDKRKYDKKLSKRIKVKRAQKS